MDERQRHEQGMAVRREVLGAAHVDRATSRADALDADFQDFLTRYAWGEVWSRPGLPRPTRSLLTLAMLVALNRPDEFRMHVRAAVANGVTREEIAEVLMQAAVYCGLPAANAAFHLAKEELAAIDAAARGPDT
jgi:4-carboxymuconolactone decarboxylase